jgi:hypothetical protein
MAKKSLSAELEAEYSETLAQRRAREAKARPIRVRPTAAPIAPTQPPDLSTQVAQLAAAWGLKRKTRP